MDTTITLKEIPRKIKIQVGSITRMSFPDQGNTSQVAVIESEKGLFVVKRAIGKQYSQWLTKELLVLKCLEQTLLPVPKVFDFIIEDNTLEAWLLMEHKEGQTLNRYLMTEQNQEKRRSIIFQFGEMMKRIHSTPCPDELINESKWLVQMLEQAEYNLKHYKVDGTKKLLGQLVEKCPTYINDLQAVLIHGDFTIDNILVQNDEISAVIDWSGGGFGDPRYDASLAVRIQEYVFKTQEEMEVFFEGYGDKIIDAEGVLFFEKGLYQFF